ncbi:hypothetical protein FRC03_008801 [Tulasnella sp. 419]|nr:hypothetical protein FRC03_008801 [Tulasnella sp. 419]
MSTGCVKGQAPFSSGHIAKKRPSLIVTSLASVSAALVLWQFASSLHWKQKALANEKDPALGWKDDIWPIRQQKPWDISTDFEHSRDLTYDVEEGTWLRLDVSPEGEIVFDMLGDIYCLPASALKSSEITRAYPVLVGVPHDSDPHFSPDGKQLAFRSDAGLGVENIWIRPWHGCENAALHSYGKRNGVDTLPEEPGSVNGGRAAGSNSMTQEQRRLSLEGRSEARLVTNETYRWVSDPRFHPDGTKIIATKWYTSGRSLGAGEGWEYDLSQQTIAAGDGKRLVGRSLPFGWTAEQYGNQQIGPEQFIWWGKDRVIYSKNVVDVNGAWEYSKDVHSGIYAIFAHNLTSGVTETLVDSVPGGATRPELSRDGRTLAFVRRVRDKEALVLKDLTSGTIRNIWYGLTYDLQGVSAPMGTYPSFAFTPGDESIVIWAAGGLWNVPLKLNPQGERVRAGEPQKIKWKATIHKKIAETRYSETDIAAQDTQLEQRLHSFKDLSVDDSGSRVVFQAAGLTYVQETSVHAGVDSPAPILVPRLSPHSTYYAPSFVPHLPNLVIHARWSDTEFTTFEIADINKGVAYELTGLPFGRYSSAILCECQGDTRRIAVIRLGGDSMTGRVVATAGAGIYMGHVKLPSSDETTSTPSKLEIQGLQFVSKDTPDRIRFTDGAKKLILHTDQSATVIDLDLGADEFNKYKSHTLAEGRMSQEIAAAPEVHSASRISASSNVSAAYVAFVDFFQVYLVEGGNVNGEPVWSKPGPKATKGLARVSVDGGHDLAWSADGKRLFWVLGPFLHSIEVSRVSQCKGAIEADPQNFGFECIRHLLDVQEITVKYETDVSRISKEAKKEFDSRSSTSDLSKQEIATRRINADLLVITNATLVTMQTGIEDRDVVPGGMLFIRGGVIQTVGVGLPIPPGAKVIDAEGGIVVPGFIDAHAHWSGDYSVASSWEHRTFLAYGCTTMHNPSLDNVDAWAERGRVESGKMLGPRIFHTGTIIYGAGAPQYHQDIADDAEAISALVRIKAEGGPYSFSYKNYNLPSRASRQRLIKHAKDLNMIVVPEGGMNWDWDITYIIDGMTTVEHSLPVPVLYDDVITLFTLSGTSNTPTHIVNYGGTFGEQYVWANIPLPFDEKLREFIPHSDLEVLSESTSRPVDSYQFFNTSASVYKMTKRGLNANIGAHGEPPLGVNYHAEMFFFQRGGMTPYEVLRSATRSGALSLGLFKSIGSLSQGKLADLVIYPPAIDVLADISVSKDIRYVVRGGRVWEASTMTEEWPVKGRKQTMPPYNAD